jgi:sialate O-acetylesterase
MRVLSLLLAVVLVAALCCSPVLAHLSLPAVISSHMVLQRDTGAVVWGHSDTKPGSAVTLTFTPAASGGAPPAPARSQSTHVQADGSFTFNLGALPVTLDASILIHDADSSVTLMNVAVGDVFLCAGQSNMEFDVSVETTKACAKVSLAR